MTIEKYYSHKRTSLCRRVSGKTTIFLDTNYWVKLRDAKLGRGTPKTEQLLELLRKTYRENKAVFPVSSETIAEIFGQQDEVTLFATVDLVDELSSSLSIITYQERREFDFFNELRLLENEHRLEAVQYCWTTVSFCRGLLVPASDRHSLELGKEHIDQMWDKPLRHYIEVMGYPHNRQFPKFPDISTHLNSSKVSQASSYQSRKEIYKSLLAGMLDDCLDLTSKLASAQLISLPADFQESEHHIVGKNVCESIFEKLIKNKDRQHLPSFHIPCSINATIWWDRSRRFKPNDWLDFQHAVTAIPHCDAFITEKSLAHLATQQDTNFEEEYNCTIISSLDGAIGYLESLTS